MRMDGSRGACNPRALLTEGRAEIDAITTCAPPGKSDGTRFFRIVKDRNSDLANGQTEGRRADFRLTIERELVEVNGIEPMTSCLQSRRSPN